MATASRWPRTGRVELSGVRGCQPPISASGLQATGGSDGANRRYRLRLLDAKGAAMKTRTGENKVRRETHLRGHKRGAMWTDDCFTWRALDVPLRHSDQKQRSEVGTRSGTA